MQRTIRHLLFFTFLIGMGITVGALLTTESVQAAKLGTQMPKVLRGTWGYTGESQQLIKIGKKSYYYSNGGYGPKKWHSFSKKDDIKLTLSKKVRSNKTFTINRKPNKRGRWIMTYRIKGEPLTHEYLKRGKSRILPLSKKQLRTLGMTGYALKMKDHDKYGWSADASYDQIVRMSSYFYPSN